MPTPTAYERLRLQAVGCDPIIGNLADVVTGGDATVHLHETLGRECGCRARDFAWSEMIG